MESLIANNHETSEREKKLQHCDLDSNLNFSLFASLSASIRDEPHLI